MKKEEIPAINIQKKLSEDDLSHPELKLSTNQCKILNTWISRFRSENMKNFDIIEELDRKWNTYYNLYRVRNGFQESQMIANIRIFNIIAKSSYENV